MNIYFPGYYHSFQCVAAACPDSCCKEWAVDIDPDAAAYYRALPGALGDRLRTVLQDVEDVTIMRIEDGRCPMWRRDGLCRIQAELGHNALCKTCREFPRLRHDYGNFVELGLELSCPEAARIILTSQDHHLLVQAQPGGEAPEYDAEVMEILCSSRKEILDFLENDRYSLPETLAIILLHCHSVQAQLDGGDSVIFDPDECLSQAQKHAAKGSIDAIFTFFSGLEILTDRWKTQLQRGPEQSRWVPPLRALMRYMVQRYWLQAIADFDLVSRVKLAIVACLLVSTLGGNPIEAAQQFSKEIENDPDNIEAILDGAYTSPALTDVNLISLLLS